ncbi:M20 family metallopeptidase [Ignicoccus hospitalis]|uniref:Acetylornithine deacetylase or succinyl-diaminopimelate desuccinylase n=1 Tax=Ignicoccus hospitalis (strain KIN4/I / DSM 18386 / JCM 14125) TaxID=453591 RepID=A8A9V1_IGNH4|nr:M20 family metallopeptidase [Ignicoccus hospitalis]ABU81703.1 acetylornithine deacetylase or succinyl-diaminopimelate desuccinylase [Ignicoccus hospitalis KIN4/I]
MSPQEVLDLLSQLISFDTVSPEGKQYEDLVHFLKGWLEERGVSAKVEYVDDEYRSSHCPQGPKPLLFAWVGEGEPLLEFNGHYDVVPPGDGWEGNPFEPKVVGEYLVGRGATDMKGGVAAVAASLAELSNWKGNKVQAVFVPDEEVGGRCGTGYRVSKLKEKYPIGRHVVIAEPSSKSVWIGHKGAVWLEVKVKGSQAHASTPWMGENAFLKASNVATALYYALVERFSKRYSKYEYTSEHPLAKFNTVSVGGVAYSTSNKVNVIPGSFVFSVDIRVIPEESAERVAEEVYSLLPEYAEAKALEMMEPFINEGSEVAEVIREAWGHPPKVCEGGLDLRYYKGYDAVAWGPGEISEAHKPNEKVRISDVLEFARMYSQLPLLLKRR